jgi:hypothetical protein
MIVEVPELLVQMLVTYQRYSTLWQVVGIKLKG